MDFSIKNAIELDPDDPFKSDLLNRKDEITNLTLLARHIDTPAVIAIDSRWGTGKTTFIKLWEHYLKTEEVRSLYFNAWETDFSKDPLVAFLGEMNEGLKESTGGRAADAWKKTKEAGKQIAKRGVPAIIRIVTAGAVNPEGLIGKEITLLAGALADDALSDYLQQKESISEFKSALTDFIKRANGNKQLIIFVDELDRCRPSYAIELLERIKHLFNIPGILFVLALDKRQLSHSIAAVYGNRFDSDGYLRRFIDLEYNLKEPDIEAYTEYLVVKYGLEIFFDKRTHEELRDDKQQFQEVFTALASALKLSLREIEQFVASFNIAAQTARENEYLYPALLIFLMLTRHRNPDAYRRYIAQDGDESELVSYLHRIVSKNIRISSYSFARVEGFLIQAKNYRHLNPESDALRIHRENSENYDGSADDLENRYSYWVTMIVDDARRAARGMISLDPIAARIEWTRRFDFLDN